MVVSTLILLLGLFSLGKLPIRPVPAAGKLEPSPSPPSLPGASADLMQGFVTEPIAQACRRWRASTTFLDLVLGRSVGDHPHAAQPRFDPGDDRDHGQGQLGALQTCPSVPTTR
ncbi:hypothetical protein ACG3RN_26200 [Pseudomonas aeruginosa]